MRPEGARAALVGTGRYDSRRGTNLLRAQHHSFSMVERIGIRPRQLADESDPVGSRFVSVRETSHFSSPLLDPDRISSRFDVIQRKRATNVWACRRTFSTRGPGARVSTMVASSATTAASSTKSLLGSWISILEKGPKATFTLFVGRTMTGAGGLWPASSLVIATPNEIPLPTMFLLAAFLCPSAAHLECAVHERMNLAVIRDGPHLRQFHRLGAATEGAGIKRAVVGGEGVIDAVIVRDGDAVANPC